MRVVVAVVVQSTSVFYFLLTCPTQSAWNWWKILFVVYLKERMINLCSSSTKYLRRWYVYTSLWLHEWKLHELQMSIRKSRNLKAPRNERVCYKFIHMHTHTHKYIMTALRLQGAHAIWVHIRRSLTRCR